AGQQINILNGVISQTQNPLTPDMQHLIQDVFSQKFTDNTNTKTTTTIGSSTADNTFTLTFKENGTTATATYQTASNTGQTDKSSSGSGQNNGQGITHVPGAPIVTTQTAFFAVEIPGKTNDAVDLDQINFQVGFTDINVGDRPTATADFSSFTYKDVHGNDVTASLSALQKADIAATETALTLTPDPGNTNNGFVGVLYSLADKNFDFLAAGEELTLTYTITVNTNYGPDPEATNVQVTFTIIGTNDQPIIATDHAIQKIAFSGGTSTSGGPLISGDATAGTFAFTDVDLTDTHTVSAALTSWTMSDGSEVPPAPLAAFKAALAAAIGTDSTGTGNGVINWHLADIPAFDADFIPVGQTLTLTYTVTVTDSQGATDTKTIEVTITGTDHAAEVWIHTTDDGSPNNLWTTAQNWETGTIPVATDDVIIITDQLHGHVPAFPAVIDASTDAVARSVTMNDFSVSLGDRPELDNFGTLTIGTTLSLGADSILHNFGTVNVGTMIELLDDGTVPNAAEVLNTGTLNLALGGDFQGLASITNSGTIEVQGGTLNVLVDVANSVGETSGQIIVDAAAKLVLGTDPADAPGIAGGITGGIVTVNSGGELDLTGGNVLSGGSLVNNGQVNVTGIGNELLGETVTNTGTIEVTAATLTIDPAGFTNTGTLEAITGGTLVLDGETVTNSDKGVDGTVSVDASSELDLEGATISGGLLSNSGTVDSTGTSALTGVGITNIGTIEVTAGTLTIDPAGSTNTGTLEAITGGTLVLDGETVTNGEKGVDGTVSVDARSEH